ncbi:toll-like receptor 6 [Plodia interpunctella]|uniref:toll-like receptor 6 n=1 Tax=Plodia interpunctella TaxID=58824 RepID=UPI0023684760|nr:toll-like receptor 6 [Plodia interpunctella]
MLKQTFVKRLDRRTFNRIIVYVLFYCHVIEKYSAAEMPHECAYRSSEAETVENVVLFCKIRTISNLDHLLRNITRTHFDDVISLHVQCSEILFFESTLNAHTEKAPNKQANLAKLRDLVIDKCKIRQIPARAFENFKDLKRLHVTTHNSEWSAMTMELHEQAFSGLNELIELNLSDNNIWSTKTETFCSLYSLKTLNLTRNHLQNIKTIGFSDSLREQNLSVRVCNLVIEILDISYNDLIVVTDNSLSKLRSLSKLMLQNNAISTLEDGAFAGLLNLQVLNLSSNFMNSLPPDIFSDTKFLTEIHLSNNTINILHPGLFEGLEQLQILDLSHNELTSQWVNKGTFVGLLRMVILNISYNKLSRIERHTFQSLYSLQKLNLEHNEITSIDEHAFEELRNLHSLTLSYNYLVHLQSELYTDLHVLHELFIDNNKIKHIDDNAFDNMTTVEDLGLNDNFLSSIPTSIHKLRSLKSLDIGNNNISHLNRENFRGLSELFGLRLVDNKVTHLSEDTFEHLPQLQVLNLASNKIKYVTPGCFRKNVNLKLLRMDGNNITTFDGIFITLNSLVWLNMSSNKIVSFDFRSFPESLEWLDLHENYIENFINDDMYSNVNIKLLDLSHNNISQLTITSIPKSVEKLYLNDNKIQHIQVGTFSKLQKLSIVTLNNNNLVQLDVNAFRLDQIDEDSDLPEFFISGNPFVCDCSMEWIQRINYLSHSRQYPRVLDLDKALCSLVHSRAKQKKLIIDMSPSDFLCPYESHCFALCHCCDFVACDCEMICPNNCRCYHDITWNANVVDCSNAGYTEVPERIPMDATEIYLDGNHISNLGNHVFIGKKKLQILYLNNTKLKEVNNQTFKGVESLRVLHLENNKLVELKGDEFLHLNNLNELYLDHNAIVHVANNTFSSLKSLSVLRIDDNKLVNFFPWKLLASSSKSLAHVSIEGNQYSCDCKSIAELDSWLRRDPGDPEKMLCTDTEGKPTKITIASVLSHCKEYMGSIGDPTVSKDEIVSKSIFLPDNYFAIICGVIIIIVFICLIGAIFYAFRYEVSDWLYTKYGVPLFKEQSCPNVDHVLEGNPSHMYDYYVICNTKDINFVYHNIMSEIEYRKMTSKKYSPNEPSLNILTLDSFSKSSKLSKRLLIVLTTNFICNDLCDIHFQNIFYSYLKSLNRSDSNKVIFIKIVENSQISDELGFLLDKFKNISWNDVRFWDRLISLVNSTDTIITVKSSEKSVFKKSLRQTPTLRYTTMPVSNDSCSKANFTNSLQYFRRSDGESSQNESSPSSDNNTYREGDNSNNSYMSIDNRTCPRFNYDLRLSPNSGHVYSRVEDISPTVPRSITAGASGKGRTYFV